MNILILKINLSRKWFFRTLRDSIGRVHFAGTETAWEWSGYINGAIASGERAAKEALYQLGRIDQTIMDAKEPLNHVRIASFAIRPFQRLSVTFVTVSTAVRGYSSNEIIG